MSNHLAIATVTAVLRQVLSDAVNEDVNGTDVTILPPDAALLKEESPRLNLYLYQVTPNAAWRNADLPARRSDGTLAAKPQLGLDLHYLLTAYGRASKDDPEIHRVLGSAVRALHEKTVLTRERISAVLNQNALKDSDLAGQVEMVKLTMHALSLEELSKLWSIFFQTPYRLSVAYQASVVLIDGKSLPRAALPVSKRAIYVTTFQGPVIDQILSQCEVGDPFVADQQILSGYRLRLVGKQLHGDKTLLKIDGVESDAVIAEIQNTQITLLLPSDLSAGVHTVQVLHKVVMGDPKTDHWGMESNAVPFILSPKVEVPVGPVKPVSTDKNNKTVYETTLQIEFDPPVYKDQRVIVTLNEYQVNAKNPVAFYSIKAPADNGITATDATPTSSIEFILVTSEPPKSGNYFVLAQVDGVASVVNYDPPGPLLEIQNEP
jgi:hypothetical protein